MVVQLTFHVGLTLPGTVENLNLESVKKLNSPQFQDLRVSIEWACRSIVVLQWEVRILGTLVNAIDRLEIVE
jgi:hypothetical protein